MFAYRFARSQQVGIVLQRYKKIALIDVTSAIILVKSHEIVYVFGPIPIRDIVVITVKTIFSEVSFVM